jgi:hypothetical protein
LREAPFSFLPRDSGEGGPPEGWWKGRRLQLAFILLLLKARKRVR